MRTVARGGAVLAALLFCTLALSACGSRDARSTSYLRRGERYLAQDNPAKAQVEFRNAMQIAPRRADVRVMSGRVAEQLGDIREALALYQSAVDVDGDYVPARASLGRLYAMEGVPQRALDVVRPALLHHPDDPDLLAVRGAARAELRDRPAALTDAERAVKLAPLNEDAVALLAALYRDDGRSAEAIDLLRTTLAQRPKSVSLRRILADLYIRTGQDDLAEAQLAKLVQVEPNNLTLREQLASFYVHSKRVDDAERVLRDAIIARPDQDEAKLAYVALLVQERSPKDGERALEGFIAHNPDDYDLRLARADLLKRENDSRDAMTAYRELITRAGDRPQGLAARDHLALMELADRHFDEASVLVGQALEKNARDSNALAARADIALARGEPEAAVADLRAVLRDQPRSVPILRSLARAYLGEGQTTLAEESLRNAVDAAPQDDSARVELARLLAQTGRAEAALGLLKARIEQMPADILAHEALVRIDLEKQDLEAARQSAEQLKRVSPGEWRGPYLEGLVAVAQKHRRDAEGDFEQALSLKPDAIEALRALSQLEVGGGHPNLAIARAQSLAAAHPADARLCGLLGELRMASKDEAGAIRELTRCAQLEPSWWLPYHDLGAAQLASGDAAGAARTLEQGVATTGMEPELVIDLAGLDQQQGHADDAIRVYEALHQEFPGLALAANNLAMLLVTYRKDRASLDRARDLTSRFLSATDPDLLDTAGWVRLKDGDVVHALPALEEAARHAPGSHVIRYHLGMAQLEAGQRTEARASLESALAGSVRFEGWDDAHAALARLGS